MLALVVACLNCSLLAPLQRVARELGLSHAHVALMFELYSAMRGKKAVATVDDTLRGFRLPCNRVFRHIFRFCDQSGSGAAAPVSLQRCERASLVRPLPCARPVSRRRAPSA